MIYANEAAFSRALATAMRKRGMFVQRIESQETGSGIPDIFFTSQHGGWLELKRCKSTVTGKDKVKIPWRPGQQAWQHTVSTKMFVATLACFDDTILLIRDFLDNPVDTSKCIWLSSIRDVIEYLALI